MGRVSLDTSEGSGSATSVLVSTRTASNSVSTVHYETHRFSVASVSPGWRFVRWEACSASVSGSADPVYGPWTSLSSSAPYDAEFQVDSTLIWAGTVLTDNTYTKVRAVFVKDAPPVTATVTVLADPADAGTVAGGGQYQVGAVCTITATPGNGCRFVKWESGSQSTTVNPHSFSVSGSVTWTAKFRRYTQLLLHGASGTLLHGSSGTLLHDA